MPPPGHKRHRHARPDHDGGVCIEDDGVGFGAPVGVFTYGLAGMRERVAALGGWLQLDNRPAGGAWVVPPLVSFMPTRPAIGRMLMSSQRDLASSEMSVNRAWLITGIPGAGKTTVSRLLAARFSRGVHIPGDAFHMWILSGRVLPGHAPAAEAQRQMNVSVHIQALVARSYAEAGFVPVLDNVVVTRERLDRYCQALTDLTLYLVVLHPGRETARLRDQARLASERYDATVFNLEDDMVRELSGIGLWIDNRTVAPDESVETILQRSDEARLG